MQSVNLCKEVLENAIRVHETCEKCGMETQPLDVVAVQAMKELLHYRQVGTVEECRAAVEKQTAISRELIEGKYFCPKCHNLMPYPGYCGCGQRLY